MFVLKCFGRNDYGQLGLEQTGWIGDDVNEMGNRLPFIKVPQGYSITQIEAGQLHTCMVLNERSMQCWGYNSYGALGLGHRNNRGDTRHTTGDYLAFVELPSSNWKIKSIHLSSATCVHFETNQIGCWGRNDHGQLGLGDSDPRGTSPSHMGDNLEYINFGNTTTLRSFTSGPFHSCATFDDGRIKCFGTGLDGQLGLGDSEIKGINQAHMGNQLPFVDLGDHLSVIQLSLGRHHSCALLNISQVKCWGYGAYLGIGYGKSDKIGTAPSHMGNNLPFLDFGEGLEAVYIASSYFSVCAILNNGRVKVSISISHRSFFFPKLSSLDNCVIFV